LWCLCVLVGVPLEDRLRCLCHWSLDLLGGALALVSSGFLPLGRSVFRWSCVGGVLHVLWVWSMYLFYLNTIRAMHDLEKIFIDQETYFIPHKH
jgi:hypothetical protein